MLQGGASRGSPKLLRVGVLQGGVVVDERLLRERQPVSIGSGLRNTFTLTAPGVPNRFVLFAPRGSRWSLQLDDRMEGRVTLDEQGPRAVDALRGGRDTVYRDGRWSVPLDERARGKIVLGEVTFLFHFVAPPPRPAAPLADGPLAVLPGPPAKRRELSGLSGLALILSVAIQVGYLAWVAREDRPGPVNVSDGPDAAIRVVLADLAAEVIPPVPGNGEVIEGEPLEVAEVREADTPSLEAAPEEAAPDVEMTQLASSAAGSPDDRLAFAQGIVRQQAFWSTFAEPTGGGGYLPVLEQIFNATDRDVDVVLSRQMARGDGRLAASQGGPFWTIPPPPAVEAGAMAVELGRSRIADRANDVGDPDERERVRVEARVRHAAARTVGAGSIDRDALDEALRARVRDVERCYERALNEEPTLGGRIVLQFQIDADGGVGDVVFVENELGEEVAACIGARVRRWRLVRPEGGAVTVRKSYILMPAE